MANDGRAPWTEGLYGYSKLSQGIKRLIIPAMVADECPNALRAGHEHDAEKAILGCAGS